MIHVTKAIPWVIYALSVVISKQYCVGYWVVGPVFAVALLLANYDRVFKAFSKKHLVFILASTVTYALVCLIATRGWKLQSEWLEALFGALTGGVVVGSVLMPFIHAKLFGVDLKTAKSVSIQLILSWYIVIIISLIDEWLGIAQPIDYIFVAIALWQGIYFKRLKPN